MSFRIELITSVIVMLVAVMKMEIFSFDGIAEKQKQRKQIKLRTKCNPVT